MNLEVSEVLITHVTYRGNARVMLHTGAGQSNNYQIIPGEIKALFSPDNT